VRDQKHFDRWLKWGGTIILLVTAVIGGFFLQKLDWNGLKDLKPSLLAAVFLLLALFLIKALTLAVIPSNVVYLLAGLYFPLSLALALVLLGITGEFVLNAYMGRKIGRKYLHKLTVYLISHSDMIRRLVSRQLQCDPLTIFLLRFLPGPTNNVTSIFLCSFDQLNFRTYLWSSVLGAAPKAVTLTIAGHTLLDPLSWQFVLPLFIFGLFSALVILWAKHRQTVSRRLAASLIQPVEESSGS